MGKLFWVNNDVWLLAIRIPVFDWFWSSALVQILTNKMPENPESLVSISVKGYQRKQNGKKLVVQGKKIDFFHGEINGCQVENILPTSGPESFPSWTPRRTGSEELVPWRNFPKANLVTRIWLETFGSGLRSRDGSGTLLEIFFGFWDAFRIFLKSFIWGKGKFQKSAEFS